MIVKCKDCKAKISDLAKVCLKCNCPRRITTSSPTTIIIAIILSVLIAGMLVGTA